MEKLTAREFRLITRENPRWADELTNPVAITQYCGMGGEPIQRLSKFLHFVGTDNYGQAADFQDCTELENAAGVFAGSVNFGNSSITSSEDVEVEKPNDDKHAANFDSCYKLLQAEGRFNGSVVWAISGIHRIGKLEFQEYSGDDWLADFRDCRNLKILTGYFPGSIMAEKSGVETIHKLQIAKSHPDTRIYAALRDCPIKRAPIEIITNPRGYPMNEGIRQQITKTMTDEQKARRMLKNQPTFEL